MAILKVARLGHPILRTETKSLDMSEIELPETQRFIDDMIETMREYDGVGLAATQVHVAKQIAVIEVNGNPRYPDMASVPLTVLINPRITKRSKKYAEGWEGCLSIPDMRGAVPRNQSLSCEALDREGKPLKVEAKNFFARVIQHECDHLQGGVYVDRMPNLKTLTFLDEWSRYWVKESDE